MRGSSLSGLSKAVFFDRHLAVNRKAAAISFRDFMSHTPTKKKWLQNSETLSNLPRRLHSYVAPMLSASPRQSTSMDKVQLIATSKRCLYQSLQCVLHADISNGINRILAAPCHSYVASMLFASLTTVHLHGRSSARCLYQSLQNVRGA